jgi:hypothetical protein
MRKTFTGMSAMGRKICNGRPFGLLVHCGAQDQ